MQWLHMPQVHTRLRTNRLLPNFTKLHGSRTSREVSYQVSRVGTHNRARRKASQGHDQGDKPLLGASYLQLHHRRLFCGTTTMNAGREGAEKKRKHA